MRQEHGCRHYGGSGRLTAKTETDLVKAARARVPSLGPHGQAVPGCACHLCISLETLQQCGARKEWGGPMDTTLIDVMWSKQAP
jgi:hypothetical protein